MRYGFCSRQALAHKNITSRDTSFVHKSSRLAKFLQTASSRVPPDDGFGSQAPVLTRMRREYS